VVEVPGDLLKFAVEPTLIGKRFILAFMVVAAYLYVAIAGTPTGEMSTVAGMVLAFYFGTHTTDNKV
jgi:hypothetical protein